MHWKSTLFWDFKKSESSSLYTITLIQERLNSLCRIQLDGGKMARLVAASCWTSMNVHMTFESEGLSESTLTDITHKHLLAGMGDHVACQVVRLTELFVTQLAAVRSVGAVNAAVTVTFVCRREAFVTSLTCKHIRTGDVLHPMSFQWVRMSKALWADCACIWLVSEARMHNSHVSVDETSCWELNTALKTRLSLELSSSKEGIARRRVHLAVMAAHVTVELIGGQEPFATLRADVSRDAAVVLEHVSLQRLPWTTPLTAHRTTPHLHCTDLRLLIIWRRLSHFHGDLVPSLIADWQISAR